MVSLPMMHGKQACGIPLLLQYQLGNSQELVPSPTLTHGTATGGIHLVLQSAAEREQSRACCLGFY